MVSPHPSGMMRITLICLLVPLFSHTQSDGLFYNYKSAFSKRDSVKAISIQCAYDNEMPTDGCYQVPDSIHFLKNLEYLSISETKVKELPSSINQLGRLKELRLGLNPNFDYERELPKLIGLDSLETLDLRFTNFEHLPSAVAELKTLKKIGVSSNHKINLRNTFSLLRKLPKLQTLDISGTGQTIPANIKQLRGVISVNLGYMKNTNIKKSIIRLSKLKIQYLDLEYCSLTESFP